MEGESSGAPGGGVAAVGADDVAGFALAEICSTGLNRRRVISKEQSACLGGKAIGSRIGVPSFGIDPLRGDEVVPTSENITFGSHGRVATCGGTKLRFVNSAKKLGHLTLLSIHLVIDLLLFGHLGVVPLLLSLLSLEAALGLGHELLVS